MSSAVPSRKSAVDEAEGVPDEPPPSYEASASGSGDAGTSLEAGPSRPFEPRRFQMPPGPPPPLPTQQSWGSSFSDVPGQSSSGSAYRTGDPTVLRYYSNSSPAAAHHFNGSNSSLGGQQPPVWSPTDVPKPGHPLKLKGKMLNYPAGHRCDKCQNSGFKAFDPSNPCKKCWSKYGKDYAGAFRISMESAAASAGPGQVPPNAQQPLPIQHSMPNRAPPRPQAPPAAPSPAPSNGSSWQPPMSSPSPPQPYYGQSQYAQQPDYGHHLPYGGGGYMMPGPYQQQQQPPLPQPYQQPPIRMQAGDPRLGGRLCPSCDGDGCQSMLFFSETCYHCRGMGRVYH